MTMNIDINKLLECLTLDTDSDAKIERCGFLLSMLIERNSAQCSPATFYQEVLPEPYLNITLEESEYRNLILEVCTMLLNSPTICNRSQDMLLFAIGGTDTRTLDLTIPALVHFLPKRICQPNLGEVTKCLQRMLSSPEAVQNQASKILPKLQDIDEIYRTINEKEFESREEAIAALDELQQLLQS